MNERPTPETDAFFRSFADGDAAPSHAEYYDRMTQLERKRDEAREQRDESLRLLGKWEQVAIGAGERVLELTRQRDVAISIGLDAVGQLIDLHHTTPKRERNVEWECRADLLDRNFRKLEDLPDPQDFSCKPPNPA